MAKLSDLRRRLRDGSPPPPSPERSLTLDDIIGEPEERPAVVADARYKIKADGSDALLKFGKHRGKFVSDLAKAGDDYLDWILRDKDLGMPEELKNVIRYQQKLARPPR